MYSIIDRSLSQTQQLHGDVVRAPLGDGLLDEFLGERLRILIRGRREQIVRDLLEPPTPVQPFQCCAVVLLRQFQRPMV